MVWLSLLVRASPLVFENMATPKHEKGRSFITHWVVVGTSLQDTALFKARYFDNSYVTACQTTTSNTSSAEEANKQKYVYIKMIFNAMTSLVNDIIIFFFFSPRSLSLFVFVLNNSLSGGRVYFGRRSREGQEKWKSGSKIN